MIHKVKTKSLIIIMDKIEITICKKCYSKKIKTIKQYNKNKYVCLDCGGCSYDNTKLTRHLKIDDYTIYDENTLIEEKNELYNFLFKDIKSKNKFLATNKNVDLNLKRWLDINYIKILNIDITLENVFNYCKNIKEEDMLCKNPNCKNKTDFFKIWDRNPNGRKHYCCKKCLHEHRSIRQKGENNTCHKMTDETKNRISLNQSKLMKDKIKNGKFTPNITNSWCRSMCKIIIDNKIKKVRSTWEAVFYLYNNKLLYESVRIPYVYKNITHNYIIDFEDKDKKILYEIKPKSERYKLKNKLKRKYAKEWCDNNDYKYIIIDDNWFYENYNNYYKLIENQPDELKILKNIKQFSNENKKN